VPSRIKYAATEENLNGHHGFITDAGVAYKYWPGRKAVAEWLVCYLQGVYMAYRLFKPDLPDGLIGQGVLGKVLPG
jgi:hypothetical protein